ncbi:polysaccharide biosynthesis/export family protein [Bradyrhizobium sp. Ec3.3]|uniref:polysaccharide biosynthesis/export family protein n=1 Tax=Bradyrhizobium sp. Ec3.3 TaxID=189753 RepID=UPI0006886507|nr:polysaccharide biosynthesis/export family protein [Bradyrhizobium sp. Ec3.3]
MKLEMKLSTIWVFVGLAAGGCSALPRSGPMAGDVTASASRSYELFDISPHVVTALQQRGPSSLVRRFGDAKHSPEPTIGVGDSVVVNIWEAPGGVLFASSAITSIPSTTGSRNSTVPDQVVGRDGAITVPFAGRIRVAGQTTRAVEDTIRKGLAGKATDAQVVVNVTRPVSSTVTVTGEVANSARVPLTVGGDRILDVVAASGGLRAPVNETYLELTRRQELARIPMLRVTKEPRENIYLRPNDVLTLVRAPQKFLAYGATGSNAEIPFDADGIMLAEALAKAGGLLDYRSDPAGVFVFRYEPSALVQTIDPHSFLATVEPSVPVVYRLDLRSAEGFFLAQKFPIMNRDVVYVSSAPLTDLQKIMGIVNAFSAYAVQGALIAGK